LKNTSEIKRYSNDSGSSLSIVLSLKLVNTNIIHIVKKAKTSSEKMKNSIATHSLDPTKSAVLSDGCINYIIDNDSDEMNISDVVNINPFCMF
jgi:hypothetical protein